MPDDEAARHDVVREEEGLVQADRVEDEVLDRALVRRSGHLLDDPAGKAERGVVVRDDESRWCQLLEDGHALDEARQRVIAVAGVLEEVAVPAGGVVEQLKDRHALGDLGIAERQLRNVGAHRRVEVDLALLDQPQEGDRRVRLPGRAELEERVLVDRQRVVDARHAVVGVALLVLVEDADGHPGNLEFLGQLADLGVQALVDSLIVPAYPLSRCPSTIGTRGITRWTSWSCD